MRIRTLRIIAAITVLCAMGSVIGTIIIGRVDPWSFYVWAFVAAAWALWVALESE